MQIFQGIPRKIAIGTLGLTVLGWFLVVVGYGIATVQEDIPRTGDGAYPLWAVVIGGPLAIIAAALHAVFPHPISSFLGGITAFLGVFFAANLGMLLFASGLSIRLANESNFSTSEHYVRLYFAGSFIAILFWTATMILASFYDFEQLRDADRNEK